MEPYSFPVNNNNTLSVGNPLHLKTNLKEQIQKITMALDKRIRFFNCNMTLTDKLQKYLRCHWMKQINVNAF